MSPKRIALIAAAVCVVVGAIFELSGTRGQLQHSFWYHGLDADHPDPVRLRELALTKAARSAPGARPCQVEIMWGYANQGSALGDGHEREQLHSFCNVTGTVVGMMIFHYGERGVLNNYVRWVSYGGGLRYQQPLPQSLCDESHIRATVLRDAPGATAWRARFPQFAENSLDWDVEVRVPNYEPRHYSLPNTNCLRAR